MSLCLRVFWQAFRGRKWNPLKRRVDTLHLDNRQLFLITMFFLGICFLLPTVLCYFFLFYVVSGGAFAPARARVRFEQAARLAGLVGAGARPALVQVVGGGDAATRNRPLKRSPALFVLSCGCHGGRRRMIGISINSFISGHVRSRRQGGRSLSFAGVV